MEELKRANELLRAENTVLKATVVELESKVRLLMDQVIKMGVRKDSRNSSLPPSSDMVSKKKSLRLGSGLKSGGQVGHAGCTLKMAEFPDKVIELKSKFCSKCGESLEEGEYTLTAKRQVIEIPRVVPFFEEYQKYSCLCGNCHHVETMDFPIGVNAPIQYGDRIATLVAYYSVFQNIPFARMQKMFAHQYSLAISQGTVGNILERVATKCTGFYETIKIRLESSAVVGSDETGAKVNGKKWWMWVWQNIQFTYIMACESRGFKAIQSVFPEGLPNTILVSDRWAAQLKADTKNHQLCLAHLQRDLNYVEELEKHPFASQFKTFISDIYSFKRENHVCLKADLAAKLFQSRLENLLLMPICKATNRKTATLQKSILKYCDYILPCIHHPEVPPDNNGSERAIRTIKVKQKVSGQFKSGQKAFCVIRSVIDTVVKQQLDVFDSLKKIVSHQAV